jgi:adenylate cyclase
MTTARESIADKNIHPPFKVADWYVDPATCRISRGTTVMRLEPKVMEVLVYLANNPGQVVTREDLESRVWAGTVVGYDALTSTMLKLRKAFNDSPKNPQILETVPKRGYRLVAPVSPISDRASQQQTTTPLPSPVEPIFQSWKWIGLIATILVLTILAGIKLWSESREPAETISQNDSSRLSIAVLPLDNLSEDPAQEYFADGLTNDLITDLTKISSLIVISRDSTFDYKDDSKDITIIAQELNVRYILHGSVRRDRDQIRINAILVDSDTGNNIWAERYDGTTHNVFELQDQITQKIVTALALKLTPAEQQYLVQPVTSNLEAYEYFLRGTERFFHFARSSNQEARKFFIKAIELDPNFARAYAMLAWTHTFDFMNGWSDAPEKSLESGEQLSTKALALEQSIPVAYFVRGLVYRERGEYIKALADAEKAVSLDPSYANGHVLQATLLYYAGRPQEGLEKIKMAIRLNPHHPFNYPFHLGQAYFVLGRYAEAINAFHDGLRSNPSSERLRIWLAATYAQSGQLEEARWQIDQVKLVNPALSLERQKQAFPFKDPADLDRFLNGLRTAGLSD